MSAGAKRGKRPHKGPARPRAGPRVRVKGPRYAPAAPSDLRPGKLPPNTANRRGPAHTAAGSEYADRPAGEQKALFERVRRAAPAPKETVQDITQVTASIGRALSQALHTDDRAMLDEIFQETAVTTIAATVRRLGAAESLELLSRCAEVFQAQPGRAQEVLPWIKEVVKAHAVFLLAQPEVRDLLGPVQHAIREHVATMPQLLLLEGRLEVLLSRLPGYQGGTVNARPLATFTGDLVATPVTGRKGRPFRAASVQTEQPAAEMFPELTDDSDGAHDDDEEDDADPEGKMDEDEAAAVPDGAAEEEEDADADSQASLHDSLPDQDAPGGGTTDEEDEDEGEESGDEPDDPRTFGV